MPWPNSAQYFTVVISTVGIIGSVYTVYQLYLKNKRNKLPKEWLYIGHVKRLYAYPIKACASVMLTQAECTPIGLRDGWLRDRVFIITDTEDNTAVSAPSYPNMVKIKPSLEKNILTLRYPGMEPIEIILAEVMLTNKIIRSKVYTASVDTYDCGDKASAWINRCMDIDDTTFRLVYYASEKNRPIDGPVSKWPKILNVLRKTDTGAFADEVSYHVINEASIEDLNSRLQDVQITETSFRPNILLSGAKAFDEDYWKFVKIGGSIFQVIKPCVRCVVTTLDPETGRRYKAMEPLVTLRRYRLPKDPEILKAVGNSPQMGIHMALRSKPGAVISVNDSFYVAY